MKIRADIVTAQFLLNDPKPEGMRIEADAGATKGINLNIDLNVTFDIAKLAAPIISSWILARAIRKNANVNVNCKRLPPDEAASSKMIIDAIEDEEKKKGAG